MVIPSCCFHIDSRYGTFRTNQLGVGADTADGDSVGHESAARRESEIGRGVPTICLCQELAWPRFSLTSCPRVWHPDA